MRSIIWEIYGIEKRLKLNTMRRKLLAADGFIWLLWKSSVLHNTTRLLVELHRRGRRIRQAHFEIGQRYHSRFTTCVEKRWWRRIAEFKAPSES